MNNQMDVEVWKPFKLYGIEVSNKGNVRSVERLVWNGKGYYHKEKRILKQQKNHKGYPVVTISYNSIKKTLFIHRLVAICFIPNNLNLPQINHIDGNKENNVVENLEWCDNSYNQIHAYKLGLNYVTGRAGKPKKCICQYDKNGNFIKEYNSIAEATKSLGYKSKSNISTCCKGKKKSVGGYIWKYKNEGVVNNEQL